MSDLQTMPRLFEPPESAVFYIEVLEPPEDGSDRPLLIALIDILASLCTIEGTGGQQHANSDLSAY